MKIKLIEKELSESKEVAYITFQLTENFSFKEWQFSMLETEVNWNKIKRAYSIASINNEAIINNTISFYIKKVSEYWLSKFLTHDINIWDEIDMTWPYWRLTDNWEIKNYILVSTWSWLWPILSIYKELIRSWSFNKIVNIFWERFHSQCITKIEEEFLINNDKILNLLFLSKDDKEWYRKWYVQNWIDEALNFLWTTQIKVFICGKPEMVDSIIELLASKWIDESLIKSEKY